MFDKVMERVVDKIDDSIKRIAGTMMSELAEIKQLMALLIQEQRKTNELLKRR